MLSKLPRLGRSSSKNGCLRIRASRVHRAAHHPTLASFLRPCHHRSPSHTSITGAYFASDVGISDTRSRFSDPEIHAGGPGFGCIGNGTALGLPGMQAPPKPPPVLKETTSPRASLDLFEFTTFTLSECRSDVGDPRHHAGNSAEHAHMRDPMVRMQQAGVHPHSLASQQPLGPSVGAPHVRLQPARDHTEPADQAKVVHVAHVIAVADGLHAVTWTRLQGTMIRRSRRG